MENSARLLCLLLLTGLSSATYAQTTPKAKTPASGMTMIHDGLDMVKSGKTIMDKAEAAQDKPAMTRGMKMMDKGMEMMDMGQSMTKKKPGTMAPADMATMNKGMDTMAKGKAMTSKAMNPDPTMPMEKMDNDMMGKGMGMMDEGMGMMKMCCGDKMGKAPMKKGATKKVPMKKAASMGGDM